MRPRFLDLHAMRELEVARDVSAAARRRAPPLYVRVSRPDSGYPSVHVYYYPGTAGARTLASFVHDSAFARG
jgi:hypothetical protein